MRCCSTYGELSPLGRGGGSPPRCRTQPTPNLPPWARWRSLRIDGIARLPGATLSRLLAIRTRGYRRMLLLSTTYLARIAGHFSIFCVMCPAGALGGMRFLHGWLDAGHDRGMQAIKALQLSAREWRVARIFLVNAPPWSLYLSFAVQGAVNRLPVPVDLLGSFAGKSIRSVCYFAGAS